jgi:rare lipoprotein A
MRILTQCNALRRSRTLTATALALAVTVAGVTAQATADAPAHGSHSSRIGKWFEIGRASWYGRSFQGRRTASGEAFDLNMLTCAHRTLPIGTLLRVTNLGNRRWIMVRVNDRGPVASSRIVDLSYAAARSLGFSGRGNARVRLDPVQGAEAAQLNWPDVMHPELQWGSR